MKEITPEMREKMYKGALVHIQTGFALLLSGLIFIVLGEVFHVGLGSMKKFLYAQAIIGAVFLLIGVIGRKTNRRYVSGK